MTPNPDAWEEIERMLQSLIDLQETKVLALARRLKPGLTAEDLRNAHDHRELDDADLQFEDGTLAGLLAAQAAVRARRRERSQGS
jgi:hypothetical protein